MYAPQKKSRAPLKNGKMAQVGLFGNKGHKVILLQKAKNINSSPPPPPKKKKKKPVKDCFSHKH